VWGIVPRSGASVPSSQQGASGFALGCEWYGGCCDSQVVPDQHRIKHALGLAIAAVGYLGCAQPATLEAVRIEPETIDVHIGSKANLAIRLSYSDGFAETLVNYDGLEWTSDTPGLLDIDDGKLTARKRGTTRVAGTYRGLAASATIKVLDVAQSLSVVADKTTVPLGATLPLRAQLRWKHGDVDDATPGLAWAIDRPELARIDTSGVVTGLALGKVKVTVSGSALTGSKDITVGPAAVKVLTVAPLSVAVRVAATATLQAAATYTDGNAADVSRIVNWMSSNPAIANVDRNGQVTGVAVGDIMVTADRDGVFRSVSVTVMP
jgi:trimeric autotransporter adhesin